ncbi:MAG: GTPase ObgE [Bdellovibrionales bacterium]|nr:GTPase ObgE [Bdellovibrionales bacterium]
MKFVDECKIYVRAGHGGPGACHFRREKYVPYGGPDGGNGGNGGSVILKASTRKKTLLDFQMKPSWEANDGAPGQGSLKDGKAGEHLYIELPVGTEILNAKTKELVADLAEDNSEFILAAGGKGGKGNTFYKTATNRAPRKFQPGLPGEEGEYVLSLKLVADVGIIGFPNAGKSTFISRVSAARPKVADYPFTTLTPNLGVISHNNYQFVAADIPGLIEGAHEGKGLGTTFLKHVERTQTLAHLIDPLRIDDNGELVPIQKTFEQINNELKKYSEELAKKSQIVAITKIDSIADRDQLRLSIDYFKNKGIPCYQISSSSGEGLNEFLTALSLEVKKNKKLSEPISLELSSNF